ELVDSLKALDPRRPIREADIGRRAGHVRSMRMPAPRATNSGKTQAIRPALCILRTFRHLLPGDGIRTDLQQGGLSSPSARRISANTVNDFPNSGDDNAWAIELNKMTCIVHNSMGAT